MGHLEPQKPVAWVCEHVGIPGAKVNNMALEIAHVDFGRVNVSTLMALGHVILSLLIGRWLSGVAVAQ